MGKQVYEINTMLVKDMSIGNIFATAQKIEHEKRNNGKVTCVSNDVAIAVIYIRNEFINYRFSEKGYKLTVEKFYWMRKIASDDFIQIHRVNHLAYRMIQNLADWLDDKNMLNFSAKHFWNVNEAIFDRYQKEHAKRCATKEAWITVQDHTLIVYNSIEMYLEPLENAMRDYLIQKRSELIAAGQKDDIIMIAKTYTVLIFLAVMRNTRNHFFENLYNNHGFDISSDFTYANLDNMFGNTIGMMKVFGVKFVKDKEGDYVPAGVDIAQSVRVDSIWKKIVRIMTDEDLMDQMAIEAINLNPAVKKDYEELVSKQNQAELDAAVERLKDQYRVNK